MKAGPESGKRLLVTLAQKMPDDLRPRPGDQSPGREGQQAWIDRQALGAAIEVVAQVEPIIDGSTGAPRRDAVYFRIGPVRAAEIDYYIQVPLEARDDRERLAQFRQLTPGTWIRFRGEVRRLWQGGWNSSAGRITTIYFQLDPEDDYTVAPVADRNIARP